jgi:ATP-dependent Lon protease
MTNNDEAGDGIPKIKSVKKLYFPADQLTQEDIEAIEGPLPPLPHPDTHDNHGLPPAYSGEMPDPLALYEGPKVKLYTRDALELFVRKAEISAGERHDLARLKELLAIIWHRGEDRKLATVPTSFRQDIATFKIRFPNFGHVLDHIAGACEIGKIRHGALRMTPILLFGPPGVGKTFFAETIARWMDCGFQIVRYDSAQSGSDTSGSSAFWSNAQPGKVFNELIQGAHGCANPVFFLDELDKAPSSASYDPLGPLHGLLDDSARHFEDLCFPLPIDASHVLYIAACNDVEKIAAPLQSRFRHFEIDITPEQGKSIAYKVAHEIILDLNHGGTKLEFDQGCFDELAKHSPRRMRQIVLEGIGRALSRDSMRIEVEDFRAPESSKRRMGFTQ